MSVRVTPAAFADLEEIDDYVTENFGPSRAIETRRSLCDTFELLTEFPQMGRLRPDIASRPVRFFFLKPYWIVYQPARRCSSIASTTPPATSAGSALSE